MQPQSTPPSELAAVILCAGSQRRYEGWPAPKQLAKIDGRAVLDRTVGQLRDAGVGTIHVAAHDERLRRDGVGFLIPTRSRWLAETLLMTRELWQGRTMVLLGDVVFSDAAVATLIESIGSPRFLGRSGPNHFTMCPWSELFGMAFDAGDAERVASWARTGVASGMAGGPGKLSCVYAAHLGLDPQVMQHGDRPADNDSFLAVGDWTDDLDSRLEHANFAAMLQALPTDAVEASALIADAKGLERYLARAVWLLSQGMTRWAQTGFEFVLSHRPDNAAARNALAGARSRPDPMDSEDETFWDQWTLAEGEPHPAVEPVRLALDRLGRDRLLQLLDALRRLADEGADWAGPAGRTLYRILAGKNVTDRDLLGLGYVVAHAVHMEPGADIRDLALVYPS